MVERINAATGVNRNRGMALSFANRLRARMIRNMSATAR